jgi:hypothetical protein
VTDTSRRVGQPAVLDPIGGSGFRSTGWGNGGGGQSFRPAPSALPGSYRPSGSAGLPAQNYRPQLPGKGRPVPAIRRPPVRQPQSLPDRPLPRGFNKPPQPATPRGAGPKPGRFPKGTTPARATPKGFGKPRVDPTPPPVPQKVPSRFDPFKPESVKPVNPYYKPIPRPFGPGGFPVNHPLPHTPSELSDPTGKSTPSQPQEFWPIKNATTFFAFYKWTIVFRRSNPNNQWGIGPDHDIEVHADGYGPILRVRQNMDPSISTLYMIEYYNSVDWFIAGLDTALSRYGGIVWTAIAHNDFRCVAGCEGNSLPVERPIWTPPYSSAPPTVAPPPVSIPDTIPPNLPEIFPGLPEPDYPDVPDDAPRLPDPVEPDPEPDPEEESPSPQEVPSPEEVGDGDIEPHLPPPIDPDPWGDEPEFPWGVPAPKPDSDPNPTPNPTPTPSPDPKPIPLPFPIPIPGPDPGPTPSPNPRPIPVPVPIPIPGPTPSPDPKPIPLPFPIPIPGPYPVPTPDPGPTPAPLPFPIPIPGPYPVPTPDPGPRPAPVPGDPGGPGSPGNPGGPGSPGPSEPDPYRPQPFDPKPAPPYLPSPPPTPPMVPRLPLPPSLPPFFDDNPKEPNPVDPYSPPDFIPLPKPPSGGQCKNNACFESIEGAAQGAKDKASEIGKQVDRLADKLEKYFQILDVGLLVLINDKLGPKLPGGLSKWIERIDGLTKGISATVGAIQEKLGKFARWARLGQLVNVLTFITTIHNAYMLSNSLGQTFLSMVSNGLAVFGIKDDEGQAYDLSSLINKGVEETVKGVVGDANYTTMSTEFKKANRIYQASANLLFSIQSMRFSIMSALETIGSWNARIGNALRKWGGVGESAYGWMNPSPNFDNKFTQAIQTAEEVVSQVDSVASEVLSAQETVTQIVTQKDELANSLGLGTEKPLTENKPEKDKATASKAVSVSPNIEPTDLVKPGV